MLHVVVANELIWLISFQMVFLRAYDFTNLGKSLILQIWTKALFCGSLIWRFIVWYGMVLYYMVWYCMIWYGIVLYGIV
jgi:hypothetical protein